MQPAAQLGQSLAFEPSDSAGRVSEGGVEDPTVLTYRRDLLAVA
jgi:hypothetical protein